MAVVLTSLQALRQGHFELWKETMTETQLEQFDPAIKPAEGADGTVSAPAEETKPPRKKRHKKNQEETD